jgi:hypothetical protein
VQAAGTVWTARARSDPPAGKAGQMFGSRSPRFRDKRRHVLASEPHAVAEPDAREPAGLAQHIDVSLRHSQMFADLTACPKAAFVSSSHVNGLLGPRWSAARRCEMHSGIGSVEKGGGPVGARTATHRRTMSETARIVSLVYNIRPIRRFFRFRQK